MVYIQCDFNFSVHSERREFLTEKEEENEEVSTILLVIGGFKRGY